MNSPTTSQPWRTRRVPLAGSTAALVLSACGSSDDDAAATRSEITVAGYPASHDTGPFCPSTIADEVGGLWWDGDTVDDLNGEFIQNGRFIQNGAALHGTRRHGLETGSDDERGGTDAARHASGEVPPPALPRNATSVCHREMRGRTRRHHGR